MNHSQIEELLAVYRDLRGAERAAVDAHLAECPACAARLRTYETMDRGLAALRDSHPDARLRAAYYTAVEATRRSAAAGMDAGRRRFPLPALAGLALVIVLLAGAWTILNGGLPERAGWLSRPAVPTPASALIGRFIWQTDGAFGYRILRPAGWEVADQGNLRAYAPPGMVGQGDGVALFAANAKARPDSEFGELGKMFDKAGTLDGWIAEFQKSGNLELIPLRSLPNERIYAYSLPANNDPNTPEWYLAAFKVDAGQPLLIVLDARGSYASLERLRSEKLVDDFITMAQSARAIPLDPQNVMPWASTAIPMPVMKMPSPAPTARPVVAATVTALSAAADGAGRGGRIVFDAKSDGGVYLFSVNPDGSDVRRVSALPRLGEDPYLDGEAACSPDGRHVAFSSWRGNNHDVYLAAVDDLRTERRLTGGDGKHYGSPGWTPDGQDVIYLSEADNRFYRVNLLGTDVAPLPIAGPNLSDPALSPDGSRLVYTMGQSGSTEMHIARLDGSGDVNLTAGAGHDHQPAWSPDGRQIAFYSDRGSNRFEIFVISADAQGNFGPQSEVRQLTDTPDGLRGRNNYRPAWSPDGRRIAFYSDREGANSIYLMNADGSSLRRLTGAGLEASNPCWLPPARPESLAPTPPCDLVCRDATASAQLALTPTRMATYSPSFQATEDAYNARVSATETRAAQVTATPTPTATVTPTPIPGDRPGYFVYRGESSYQAWPPFQVSYDGAVWHQNGTWLEHQALAGCVLDLRAGGSEVAGPVTDGQAALGAYLWHTKTFAQEGLVAYDLTVDGAYFLVHLRWPKDAPAAAVDGCRRAAEEVLGTFQIAAAATPGGAAHAPAGWQAYTDQATGFALAYPPTWEITQNTGRSVIFSHKQAGPSGPSFPRGFITIMPDGFTNADASAYDFLDEAARRGMQALPVGRSLAVQQPAEYNTFTRLDDTVIDGQTGLVFENVRVWEGGPSTRDRRVLVTRGTVTYMLGTYYSTPAERAEFEQVLGTFRFPGR